MDKFEEKLNELEQMSDEDKNQTMEELKGECICSLCPTYNSCAENADELLFCITGKSESCIKDDMGCICPSCPIALEYGIGVVFNLYCINDSELKQRK